MKNFNKIPTTVKLNRDLYDQLKILSIKNRFTLQTIVEKCIYMYVNQESFRNDVNKCVVPILTSTVTTNVSTSV